MNKQTSEPMTELPTFEQHAKQNPGEIPINIDYRVEYERGFNAGQASAQPIIERLEKIITFNLEGATKL